MKIPLLAALTLAAAPAALPAQNWNAGTPVRITVTNDRFTPSRFDLRRGRTYVLRFSNPSDRTHNFSAPEFFKYARVAPRDGALVAENRLTLRPGQRATLRIVAPPTPNAIYDFRSTRLGDAAEKLKGQIYVR